MSKRLDQSEIDALFSKAQGLPAAAKPQKKAAVRFDPRKSNALSDQHLAAVTTLHEGFTRRISNSLGAHFRVAFDLSLVSVEQLPYREYLTRIPDLTYFTSIHVMPIDARAAIQMDIGLVYPIIEVVLGGSVSEAIAPRDLTEIEEQILETVVNLIIQELHTSWAPVLELDFQFEQRQRGVHMQTTMVPGEKTFCLSFEARMFDVSGTMTMVFPALVANTLLRRLSAQWTTAERIPSRNTRRRLRQRMLDSPFSADLSLPLSPVTIRQILALEPGQVFTVPQRSQEPIHLNIASKPMFLAYPVRHGSQRAAKVARRLSLLSPSMVKEES